MINPFKRPYKPLESKRPRIISILVFGLFIFLFLFLFKPFGMTQLEGRRQFFISLGFGVVTVFVLVIFRYLIEPVVINDRWTLGKNILWDLLVATSIGIANYFYVILLFPHVFIFRYMIMAVWTAILVGSIPVTISYIVTFNRRYRMALQKASVLPEEVLWEDEVTIRAGNPRNEFRVNPREIVYLSSNDNYVTIVTIKDKSSVRTHLRGTLKAAESELKDCPCFIRCHKCFIVNSEYASHVAGNVQNMKIILNVPGPDIPVSRSKASLVAGKFR